MTSGITNYVAIAALLLVGGVLLSIYVHPAWGAVPAAVVITALVAAWSIRKKPADSTGPAKTDDDSERILVPVTFENATHKFYFDGKGRIIHIVGVTGENELVKIGFFIAYFWEQLPILLLEHVSRRIDLTSDIASLVFSRAKPDAPSSVTCTLNKTTGTMETARFIKFFTSCGESFSAAWGQHNWKNSNAVRETMALFQLVEESRVNANEIDRISQDPEGPLKDMEALAQCAPEEQLRVFASIEAAVMVTLLRVVPSKVSWDCIRDLPLKGRLVLVDDILLLPFPGDAEWQTALKAYRKGRA